MTDPRDVQTIDTFDRIIGGLADLPDVVKARPTTVSTVMPILGRSLSYIVQTYKQEGQFTCFLQVIDAAGGTRIAIPPKAMAAIYRQRDALVKQARRRNARDHWSDLSPAERRARVSHLHPGKAGGE